jgi:hypothetical protein
MAPSKLGTEGYDLVINVMPDVGATQPANPCPPAPVLGDILFVHSEVWFIRRDAAATAEHDARRASDVIAAGDMKQRSIDSVHRFPNLLQHEHMSVEVGFQRCAQQVAEHRHVKRRSFLRAVDSWLERLRRPINYPGERPRNRCIPCVPENVLRDRPVCHGRESGAVQSGKQHASITIAHIGLSSGGLHQLGRDRLDHAARSVSAAREPDRVVTSIVGDFQEGLRARFIVAREMSMRREALGVENDLGRPFRIETLGQGWYTRSDVR